MSAKFDTYEQRHARLICAMKERGEKIYLLEQSYRYACPERDKWYIKSPSFDKSLYWWDSTPVTGLKRFASLVQNTITPPYQNWATLVPGTDMARKLPQNNQGTLVDTMRKQLEATTDTLFRIINKSNFFSESNIAIQDMGIAVGLLEIRATGDRANPIIFKALPLHNAVFEECNGRIETIFIAVRIPWRDIYVYWPDAELTADQMKIFDTDPSAMAELEIACVYYPYNPASSRYQYTVNVVNDSHAIYEMDYEVSPFIAFRWNTSPGEVWGFGPIMSLLGWIRVANAMTDMELRAAAFKAQKPVLIHGTNYLNPFNITWSPGMQIITSDLNNTMAPVDISGDLQFSQLDLKQIDAMINEFLFVQPLGNVADTPNRSASEMELRFSQNLKEAGASVVRLENEFLRPVIAKALHIANKAGLIDGIKIDKDNIKMEVDNVTIDIEFNSPLSAIQHTDNVKRVQQYAATLGSIVGPQAAIQAFKLEQLSPYLGEQMNLPAKLFKSVDEVEATIEDAKLQEQAQQQAEQNQAAQKDQPAQQQFPGQSGKTQMNLPQINVENWQ